MLTCISWTIRLYVFLYIVYAGQCSLQRNDNADALTSFFEEMDGNRDGRLDEIEAKKYFSESIGGQEFSSSVALSNAFRRMVENIDKETEDKDIISVSEVQQHIQHLQHTLSVAEWISHGLGLPQYAKGFQERGITAEDFPFLVTDQGRTFQDELGITSGLDRHKIVRSMKRLMLGIGELPTAPQVITCLQETETRKKISWRPPINTGDPPIHKYVIETLEIDKRGPFWMIAAEVDAHLNHQQFVTWIDHPPGRHIYRVIGWSVYGPTPYAVVENCPASAMLHVANLLQDHSQSAAPSWDAQKLLVAQFLASGQHIAHESEPDRNRSKKAGYWGLFTVLVSIALRLLTRSNIASLKCCFLWKLERIMLRLAMKSVAKRISRISRHECAHCKERCRRTRGLEFKATHPPGRKPVHVQSQQMEPRKHFEQEPSHMKVSKSSPNLRDRKPEYITTEWDSSNAKEAVETLPIPEYNMSGWDEDDPSLQSSRSLSNQSSFNDVHSGLIEGQCAYEGCARKWKGVLTFRYRWSRHFCSICLMTYCYEHTHFSPHGSFGFCGQQSKCVCEVCFPKLPATKQAELNDANKLDKSPSKKAELEQGCACQKKEGNTFVRSLLGIKRQIKPRTQSDRQRNQA